MIRRRDGNKGVHAVKTIKSSMSTAQLLAIWNEQFPDTPMKAWKKSRNALFDRMVKAGFVLEQDDASLAVVGASDQPASDSPPTQPEASEPDTDAPSGTVSATDQKAAVAHAPKRDAKAKKPKARKAKKGKGTSVKSSVKKGAIREFVEAMLVKTKGTDPKTKRPLGIPYGEILTAVQAKFPEAKTTLGCLRWYCTHMNNGHRKGKDKIALPQRPKPALAAAA